MDTPVGAPRGRDHSTADARKYSFRETAVKMQTRAERMVAEQAAIDEQRQLDLDRDWVRKRRLATEARRQWLEVVIRALLTSLATLVTTGLVGWLSGLLRWPPAR